MIYLASVPGSDLRLHLQLTSLDAYGIGVSTYYLYKWTLIGRIRQISDMMIHIASLATFSSTFKYSDGSFAPTRVKSRFLPSIIMCGTLSTPRLVCSRINIRVSVRKSISSAMKASASMFGTPPEIAAPSKVDSELGSAPAVK